jgi:hypothetical protein
VLQGSDNTQQQQQPKQQEQQQCQHPASALHETGAQAGNSGLGGGLDLCAQDTTMWHVLALHTGLIMC